MSIARLLLSASADKDKPGRADGAPPLGIAASKGHAEMVYMLLDATADLEKSWASGATALGVACRYGRTTVVRLLLEAKADKDKPCRPDGGTPLGVAGRLGSTAIVTLLLDFRADQNKSCWGLDGRTPLRDAIRRGQRELIGLLKSAE